MRNTKLLMREAHPGPAQVAVAAYSGLAEVVAAWIALFALCAFRIPRPAVGEVAPGPSAWRPPPHSRALVESG